MLIELLLMIWGPNTLFHIFTIVSWNLGFLSYKEALFIADPDVHKLNSFKPSYLGMASINSECLRKTLSKLACSILHQRRKITFPDCILVKILDLLSIPIANMAKINVLNNFKRLAWIPRTQKCWYPEELILPPRWSIKQYIWYMLPVASENKSQVLYKPTINIHYWKCLVDKNKWSLFSLKGFLWWCSHNTLINVIYSLAAQASWLPIPWPHNWLARVLLTV